MVTCSCQASLSREKTPNFLNFTRNGWYYIIIYVYVIYIYICYNIYIYTLVIKHWFIFFPCSPQTGMFNCHVWWPEGFFNPPKLEVWWLGLPHQFLKRCYQRKLPISQAKEGSMTWIWALSKKWRLCGERVALADICGSWFDFKWLVNRMIDLLLALPNYQGTNRNKELH